jgi:hypothetical protein
MFRMLMVVFLSLFFSVVSGQADGTAGSVSMAKGNREKIEALLTATGLKEGHYVPIKGKQMCQGNDLRVLYIEEDDVFSVILGPTFLIAGLGSTAGRVKEYEITDRSCTTYYKTLFRKGYLWAVVRYDCTEPIVKRTVETTVTVTGDRLSYEQKAKDLNWSKTNKCRMKRERP